MTVPTAHTLRFVASMTVCPSDIRKIQHHLASAKHAVDPLTHVLITPLFVNRESLALTRIMAEQGRDVMFDSGGYYVQMGRLRYDELYMPLMDAYRTHPWATRYTLPDHVPLSSDSPDVVQAKVNQTIDYSTLFFQEMPDTLKDRAMPVVQGHTQRQMDQCLEAYFRLGVNWIGFGSFGTQGPKNEVNVTTTHAVNMARYVIESAHQHGVKVHLFGVGAPALTAMLKGVQADSFDSAGWLKAAGHGMVALPLQRYWNISHQSVLSELQQGMPIQEFERNKILTGHSCAMCDNIYLLQKSKMHRAVHNLLVIAESVSILNSENLELARKIYESSSPKYRREFQRWLSS